MKFRMILEIEVSDANILRYMLDNAVFGEVEALTQEVEMHLRNSEVLCIDDVNIVSCEALED